jgi:hypothetical protein
LLGVLQTPPHGFYPNAELASHRAQAHTAALVRRPDRGTGSLVDPGPTNGLAAFGATLLSPGHARRNALTNYGFRLPDLPLVNGMRD